MNTADILIDKLIAWKVDTIYGLIGDGINHIIEALRKRKDRIQLITVRHEEAAAFMASGYAKFSGRLGVCIATTGPGAVHLLNGLYDASMEGVPVLAITGSVNHDLQGTHFIQEIDAVSMMRDCSIFNRLITGPKHAGTAVDLACRAALTTPGVAHLTISKDTQNLSTFEDAPSKEGEALQGSAAYSPRIQVPSERELAVAAELINSCNKIAILVGRGALSCRSEVEQIAEKLGAPVAKALLGKAVLPDNSPYTTGGIGHLGTYPSQQIMQECDGLLVIGSTMPYLEYYPKAGSAKAVQIDRDPGRMSLRYPMNAFLNGDCKETLQDLIEKLRHKTNRSFLKLAQQNMLTWNAAISKMETNTSTPIKPQFLVALISELLNDDALVSIDTGAHTQFVARHWKLRANQRTAICGNLASMGPALPYAIAGQKAFPGRQSVAITGDGGLAMLMGELATAVLYKLPVKVIVFKNNSLSMDRFEQEGMGYEPFGDYLLPIDFACVAEACGAEGYRVKTADEVKQVIQTAFNSSYPALVEVLVDSNEPPLPPHEVK